MSEKRRHIHQIFGTFFTAGAARILNFAAVPMILLIYGNGARIGRLKIWYGIGVPLAALFFIFLLWNSTLKTLLILALTFSLGSTILQRP